MKGRNRFTRSEASKIRELLRQKIQSGNEKRFRGQLRAMGFYISDFARLPDGFSPDDFDDFVRSKTIIIV